MLRGGIASGDENTSDVVLLVFVCSCVYMCVSHVCGWVHVHVCAFMRRTGQPHVSSLRRLVSETWRTLNDCQGKNHYPWLPRSRLKVVFVSWWSSLVWEPWDLPAASSPLLGFGCLLFYQSWDICFPHCFFLFISDYTVSLMLVLHSFFEDDVIQKHILFFQVGNTFIEYTARDSRLNSRRNTTCKPGSLVERNWRN